MVRVHGDARGVLRIIDEHEPLHHAALDGVSEIMHSVGAVAQAKVDHRGGVGIGRRPAPEQVGWVQVIVGPQRRQLGEERQKLGMKGVFTGNLQPSVLVGRIAMFFAMLFAVVEAANRLEFTQVRDVVTIFIRFGGDVLLGGAILIIGFWLANLASGAIERASGGHATGLAQVARFAILGLVIAMGLRAMGIADDIVNLAFALTLGAVAVAVALSFGLGGREAAGRQMEHWLSKLRKEK